MKPRLLIALTVGALVVGALGYFWGRRTAHDARAIASLAQSAAPKAGPANGRKILYYRNAMGLPDTSPVPKKDAMGMDYVPVYEGEESSAALVRISTSKLQTLGVRTEPITRRALTHTLRIVGTLQMDERTQSTVSAKFEGWITRLFVSTTGARVHRGEALLEVYSPDLLSAQQDYRVAVQALKALHEG
ncbi:MAG TPA: efflux RND transporter periplasmic adaptor subunit, partial [Steroidobacteraceae bacterium]